VTLIAGVDVGNATTEVVLVAGGKILGAARVPTRGRKGSADSLRGAAALVRRAVRTLGPEPGQVLVVGGPAGDEELLSVIGRSLPDGVAVGRGNVGGTCPGGPLGHRYAVALGLALASPPGRL